MSSRSSLRHLERTLRRTMRPMATSLMVDTVRVERVTGVTTSTAPPFGTVETTALVYEGAGKIQSNTEYEQSSEVGGSIRSTSRMLLHIPVGAAVCEVGDRVMVLASHLDENLELRRWRVVQIAPYKTLATAYRLYIEAEGSVDG